MYVVEHVYEKYFQNPKEGVRAPGAEGNWELNSDLLPEQEALLTTQSSLQPPKCLLLYLFLLNHCLSF